MIDPPHELLGVPKLAYGRIALRVASGHQPAGQYGTPPIHAYNIDLVH